MKTVGELQIDYINAVKALRKGVEDAQIWQSYAENIKAGMAHAKL